MFVAGDAAHKHPPTSGLGLNSAIHDVQNLCWKLAEVLAGRAGDALLDIYDAERRPVIERNIANSVGCSEERFRLDAALGLSPEKSAEDNWKSLEVIWDESDPEHDERLDIVNNALAVQSVEFHHHGLEYGFTYDSAAVVDDGSPGPWVEAARKIVESTGLSLEAVTVGADDAQLVDVLFAWLRKRQITRQGAVLVRPDRYVGFRSSGAVDDHAATLLRALQHILANDELGTKK